MKTTDLRLGNFIQDQFGDVITVDGLDEIDVFASVFGDIPVHAVQPIALTEQWLLDFGFKENEYGNMSLFKEFEYLEIMCGRGDFYPSYEQPTEFAHEENRVVSLKQIKYVHQLQNLYFALTGNELNIKQ